MFKLPSLGKNAIETPHFLAKHQAFIFRAYEYVPVEKIAKVLKTSVSNVKQCASEMGLYNFQPNDVWLKRGYITIIRRLWHILPYDQLLEILEMDEKTLARTMREDDFLDVKLAEKPVCERVEWRELTPEEKLKTKEIKKIMSELDFSGKKPFEFEYNVPKLKFEGKEQFSTRIIYAFSGLYQNAFDVDSEEFLPDEQLKAYKDLGINGIWTQGVLSLLTPFPFDEEVSQGYEKRLEKMRKMTERLSRYGIKLYLYLNEPRSMPLAFFEKYPELKGHVRGDNACLCISTDTVRNYLKNSVERLCREVPLLGGFITITRSENMSNCYSHSAINGVPCTCPRCSSRSVGDVIADTLGAILEGARRVSNDIKVFAWSWVWREYNKDIIEKLPKGIILVSQSELDIPYTFGDVNGKVVDYSMSIVGPGERAKEEWELAKKRGLEVGAKVQINTTWEASTVPAIPLSPSIEKHAKDLLGEGVQHLILSWTLGGYPGNNVATVAKYFYEKCKTSLNDSKYYEIEKQFVKAFKEFPFDISVLYRGPQNAGPSTFLYEQKTGYKATMTCFAYDDLDSWRAVYSPELFEKQFEKLCSLWKKGLDMLSKTDESETAIMARATYCLFRSSLNQIRFIRARDEGRFDDAIIEAKNELEIAKETLYLMNKNASIGYEAANHYYFSKGQIAEKILNCNHIINAFSKKR